MFATDHHGQPVALASHDGVAAWAAVTDALLAHSVAAPAHLAALLDAEPEAGGPRALKALLLYLLGRRETAAQAREALAEARGLGLPTARERALAECAALCLGGEVPRGVAALERVLARAPGDLLLLKLSHALRFTIGDAAGMRASLERAAPAYADHPGRGYFLGCTAFAMEETGDHAEADAAGRAGLEMAPDDAWGLHAVAHVHDMRGDAAGGLAWLDGREAAWAHCNNFRFHVWWHKALMLIEARRLDEALALHDAQVRAERTDDWRDVSNAASLLMRLELEGVDVGDRWAELADLCARRTEDGSMVFADMHYLMALTADGRGEATTRMMARMARDARGASDHAGRMARPALDVGRGLEAFGSGRWSEAFDALRDARAGLSRAGGSHAQRDVFERMCVDAGMRAGRLDEAEAVLVHRTRRRGHADGYAERRHAALDRARARLAGTAAE